MLDALFKNNTKITAIDKLKDKKWKLNKKKTQ